MIIALVGKPNSGKTAFFNQLTGGRQKVANYPGVTVERKEGRLILEDKTYTVMDLPGLYSLDARSPDEVITRDVVLGHVPGIPQPNLLVCVVDVTQLKTNLRLALELKQIGIPTIVMLNMSDLAHKYGYQFDYQKLSKTLELPVIPMVAIQKKGITPFLDWLKAYTGQPIQQTSQPHILTSETLRTLHQKATRIAEEAMIQKGAPSSITQRIDHWVLNPWTGMILLLFLLFMVFQAVFNLAAGPMDLIDGGITTLHHWLSSTMPDGLVKSLVLDGVLTGVGSVIIFLPQILILYFFILVLEDSGYMTRAAFLLDKLMGGVGLHGKAFIPLLSSFACAIPGIMATRTIDSKYARLTTIMIAPLMTCSARLPVYALIISAFVPRMTLFGGIQLQGLVLFVLYVLGILSALLVAFVLKGFFKQKTMTEPFLMELPTYKWPHAKNLVLGLIERGRIFLVRAGTIIFALMVVVWFLSSFPTAPIGSEEPAIYYSFAGQLGRFLEPIFSPIGFNWQMVVALVPGMAAREVAVSTLGTVYALSNTDGSIHSLSQLLASQWTLASASAFLIWYVFAPQCVATLAVVKRETNSWIWPAILLGYLMILAYGASFITYRVIDYVF